MIYTRKQSISPTGGSYLLTPPRNTNITHPLIFISKFNLISLITIFLNFSKTLAYIYPRAHTLPAHNKESTTPHHLILLLTIFFFSNKRNPITWFLIHTTFFTTSIIYTFTNTQHSNQKKNLTLTFIYISREITILNLLIELKFLIPYTFSISNLLKPQIYTFYIFEPKYIICNSFKGHFYEIRDSVKWLKNIITYYDFFRIWENFIFSHYDLYIQIFILLIFKFLSNNVTAKRRSS